MIYIYRENCGYTILKISGKTIVIKGPPGIKRLLLPIELLSLSESSIKAIKLLKNWSSIAVMVTKSINKSQKQVEIYLFIK